MRYLKTFFGRVYLKTCTCVVERDEDRRSIKENPTVQTYDPWGLGSGQSEGTTRIARVAGGGGCIGHGLVDTRLS